MSVLLNHGYFYKRKPAGKGRLVFDVETFWLFKNISYKLKYTGKV